MAFNHEYPYTDSQMFNDDWLLATVKKLLAEFNNFVNLNKIKYANPILWDITSQYEINTVVIDPQTGDAYISVAAVPYGVHLDNTEYWTKIYNYQDAINNLQEQIAPANERLSTTATAPRSVGELVWLNGVLHIVTAPMIAGDSYVVGSNCAIINIEALIGNLKALQIPADDLVTAINNVVDAITLLIGDLSELQIPANDLVAAINNVVDAITLQIGDLSALQIPAADLVTAINNVVDAITLQIGDLSALQIPAADLVTAINNVVDNTVTKIGDLTNLKYSASDLVDAINKKGIERFTGKKILILGDSNSHEVDGVTNWVTVFRQLLPYTTIDNDSDNGALFMGAGGKAKHYFDDISGHYDYIIVVCGTNDCYHQGDIGTVDLGVTNSWDSFGAALSSFYNAVNNKDVTAEVIMVTPIKNVGMALDGITRTTPLDVYRASIIRACALFGWTLIDAGHQAPLLQPYNASNKTKWLTDGTHMSEDYAPYFARYILDSILAGGNPFSGKGIQSTIILSSFVSAGVAASIIGSFNSDGTIKIDVDMSSTSLGSGIGVTIATGLPTYCRPQYAMQVACQTGLTNDGQMRLTTSGTIQLFPTVTQDTTVHGEFIIENSMIETQYQTII